MKTLIRTLEGDPGKLYAIRQNRRTLIAECYPKVQIYEHCIDVPTLGEHSCKSKSMHSSIVICADRQTTREINDGFFKTVSRFELELDVQREDGIFERIFFDNLALNMISEDWEFNVIGQTDIIRKLLTI